MPIYLFFEVLCIESSLEISAKPYWHVSEIEQKASILSNHRVYIVFQLYLSTWYLPIFPLSCYHLEEVETKYALRICSLRDWVFVLQEFR